MRNKYFMTVLLIFGLALLLCTNVSAANVTTDQVANASGTVKSYVETNHALPSSVNVSGNSVNMPQYLELSTKAVLNINNNSSSNINIRTVSAPTAPSETMTAGVINKTEYLDIANRVNTYMVTNGRAPNYASSTQGNIRYESLVYMYSQIMNSYGVEGILPDFIPTDPWSLISKSTTKFFSVAEVTNASDRVKSYIEINHRLPNYVTIAGKQVSMTSYLKIATTSLLNTVSNYYASSILENFTNASGPTENITNRNMDISEYVDVALRVKIFMDVNKQAPNYAITSFGNMRFESLVYMYSQLLSYHNSTKYLPQNVTVNTWSAMSNNNTAFFTADQVNAAASTVKSYIEANHTLPSSVTISGKQITMPQYLKLATDALLNMGGILCTSFASVTFNAAASPSENITKIDINSSEYVDIAGRVNAFMYANGCAPNYAIGSQGNIRFESLVYMYSKILESSTHTDGTLADYMPVVPWSIVSNSSTVFLNMNQIVNATSTVNEYIMVNHALPSSVTISGRQISMPQFLKLAVKSVKYLDGNLFTSIMLDNAGNASNPVENMTIGDIVTDEYIEMADSICSYMDNNGTAPNYVTDAVLGTSMRFESLVYMYSQILNSYNSTGSLPNQIKVIPWLTVSNPDKSYNFRTQKMFNSIQAAIDDNDTIEGDDIWLGKQIISENVVINKSVAIQPLNGNVTVQALNMSLPVFTININGNSSTITNLIINGSTGNSGIFINGSSDVTISDCTFSNNLKGIFISNSSNIEISENNIMNNTGEGIFASNSSDNEFSDNIIKYNGLSGIKVNNGNNTVIFSNLISNNGQYGISVTNSSVDINFNRIVANNVYGLYKEGNGTLNATNNWWGSNNPIVSLNNTSDIGIMGGIVNYNPYIVLTLSSSCDRSNRTGTNYNYIIKADLAHNNQGADTSSEGNIPDGTPVNFSTTLGTINSSASTRKGKSEALVNSTNAGIANVSAIVDNKTITTNVNITAVSVLGILNNRTNESFSNIQDAIDDADTLNGDNITLSGGTYTEKVLVNKKLTIRPVTGQNVTIKPADGDFFVIIISNKGSGSKIQGLNIIGSIDTFGILMSSTNNCNITGNIINDNEFGIYMGNSTNNTISGNVIVANWNGIFIEKSRNNTISGNLISNCWEGLSLDSSIDTKITGNTIKINKWDGIKIDISNNTVISGNNITYNGGGVCYSDSNSTTFSGNNVSDNWMEDISQIDSTGIVMASSVFTCGPASLVTILKKLGVNTTEEEIVNLAGTDLTGTTMYGMLQAAQSKGLIAKGLKLNVNELRTDNLVLLAIGDQGHYIIVKNVTNTTVYLADTSMGNMEMSLEKFNSLYSGNALVITNNVNNPQLNNTNAMTTSEMKIAKGQFIPLLIYAAVIAAPIVIRVVAPIVCRLVVKAAIRYGPRLISYGSRAIKSGTRTAKLTYRGSQYGSKALNYGYRTVNYGSKVIKNTRNTALKYSSRVINYTTKKVASVKKVAQNAKNSGKAKIDTMLNRVEKEFNKNAEIYGKKNVYPYLIKDQKGKIIESTIKKTNQQQEEAEAIGQAAANSKIGYILGFLSAAEASTVFIKALTEQLSKEDNNNTTNTTNITKIQQHKYDAG
ncbi:MAG: hypothetical protein CVV28_11100 [Methanobacteriales archaeon HGW-Methanobacteriales-1]|nr:pseudomurein-binding repeat-containing protein [Methanobacteriaceae archaeon]PKL66418.1 MAG: hypothetical protein CVV28_11100 [Methanobacteriales archaeon HGW-Methanobacteriales-1]